MMAIACFALVAVIIITGASLILNPQSLKAGTIKEVEAVASEQGIVTLNDMIGKDNAELLALYEGQDITSDDWLSLAHQIGAEEEVVATSPNSTYRIYLVQEQDLQLSVYTKEDSETGLLDIIYEFGPLTDIPFMTEVIPLFH